MTRKRAMSVAADEKSIREVRERLMGMIQEKGIVLNEQTMGILKKIRMDA